MRSKRKNTAVVPISGLILSMPKESQSETKVDPELPFEEALEQLEELVREMESDKVPLEVLMKHYELGTRLHQVCEKRLDEAQGRIEIIRQKRDGSVALETFGEEEKPTAAETTNDPGDDSPDPNGELF